MPYLFVDYDQGAGGEFFCHKLSLEQGCVPLPTESTAQERYKVFDVFNQEFLKRHPRVSYKKAHENFYEIVPAHQNTYIAKGIGLNFKSIRIEFPTTQSCIDFVLYQQVHKVLLAPLPSVKQFFGELETLQRDSNNSDWIKQTSIDMDYLTLFLLSKGIPVTSENKNYYLQQYLEKILQEKKDKPKFDYDLIVEYESLIFDPDLIKKQIKETFGIEIQGDWLSQYKRNYDAYIAKT
jgi:hypothetical protein